MKCCYINLPSYPLSSFVDPGVWFHQINHNCDIMDLNASFWTSFFQEYTRKKRNFTFITTDNDFNFADIYTYNQFLNELNKNNRKWFFSLTCPVSYYNENIKLNELDELSGDLPLEIQSVLKNEINKFIFKGYELVIFSVHSIFEVFCMYFFMKYLSKKDTKIKFSIATTKFENFYINKQRLQSYLSLFYEILLYPNLNSQMKGYSEKSEYKIKKDLVVTLNIFDSKCYWQKCHFCFQSKIDEIKTISDEEIIIKKLFFYIRLGITKFIFLDECFTIEKLNYFADLLIKNNLRIQWFIRLRYRNDYSIELIKKLRDAGLVQILFGLESASNRILSVIEKYDYKFKKRNFLKLAQALKKNGIYIHICFIIGFPFERKADLNKTISFIKNLKHARIIFTSFVNIFQYYHLANIDDDIKEYINITNQKYSDFNTSIDFVYNSSSYWYDKNVYEYQKFLRDLIKNDFWTDSISNDDVYFEIINRTAFGLFILRGNEDKYIKQKYLLNLVSSKL